MTKQVSPAIETLRAVFGGRDTTERTGRAIFTLCVATACLETAGGIRSGSLALVAIAIHLFARILAMAAASRARGDRAATALRPSRMTGVGRTALLLGNILISACALFALFVALMRFYRPVDIQYEIAIPIAFFGLLVDIFSAPGPADGGRAIGGIDRLGTSRNGGCRRIDTGRGILLLEMFEAAGHWRFRVGFEGHAGLMPVPGGLTLALDTIRKDGQRASYSFAQRGWYLESLEEVPAPHSFTARVGLIGAENFHLHEATFEEPEDAVPSAAPPEEAQSAASTMRVMPNAAVSMVALVALLVAALSGWNIVDPIYGALALLLLPLRERWFHRGP